MFERSEKTLRTRRHRTGAPTWSCSTLAMLKKAPKSLRFLCRFLKKKGIGIIYAKSRPHTRCLKILQQFSLNISKFFDFSCFKSPGNQTHFEIFKTYNSLLVQFLTLFSMIYNMLLESSEKPLFWKRAINRYIDRSEFFKNPTLLF